MSERKGESLTKEIVRKEKEKWKDRDPVWALYVRSSRWSRAFRDRIFVLLRIRFAPCVHDERAHSWKPDTEREGGKDERESRGKRKGPRITCVGRNPSFFRSANTAALPSSLPPAHPAFALSPLVLLVIAAALLLYPSLFLPPPLLLPVVGRLLVARVIVVVFGWWKWRRWRWCPVSRLPSQTREPRARVTHVN